MTAEIAISGPDQVPVVLAKGTTRQVKTGPWVNTVAENVVFQRQSDIRELTMKEKEYPPELAWISDAATAFLIQHHGSYGVSLTTPDIPPRFFVDGKNSRQLWQMLGSSMRGEVNPLNGGTIIIHNPSTPWSARASLIAHELFHSVGTQIISAGISSDRDESGGIHYPYRYNVHLRSGRVGLLIGHGLTRELPQPVRSPLAPWLLEEAGAMHAGAQFIDYVEEQAEDSTTTMPPSLRDRLRQGKKDRQAGIDTLRSMGFLKENRIIFPSNYEVDARYCSFFSDQKDCVRADGMVTFTDGFSVDEQDCRFCETADGHTSVFVLESPLSLAATLLDRMTALLPNDKRDEFVQTMYAARRDPRAIRSLAQVMNQYATIYWNDIGYTTMMKCPATNDAVEALIQQIEHQSKGGDRSW